MTASVWRTYNTFDPIDQTKQQARDVVGVKNAGR